MDIITYSLLKNYVDKSISQLPQTDSGYMNHKGVVTSSTDLTNINPSFGDVYLVNSEDKNYYYNGLRWVPLEEKPASQIAVDNKSISTINNTFSIVGFLEAQEGSFLRKGPDNTILWDLPVTEEKVSEIVQNSEINIVNVIQHDADELIFNSGDSNFS